MERTDVAVIGAGIAGLAAGRQLTRAGVRTVILEARDRIGGRVDTVRGPHDAPAERGAEFVHGRPESVWNLARELGLDSQEVGELQLCLEADGLGTCAEGFAEASRVLAGPVEGDPSVAALLAGRRLPDGVRHLASIFVQGFDAADPELASAAAISLQAHAADRIDGDRTFRIREGLSSLPNALARGLDVRLRHIVDQVRWEPERVEVSGHGDHEGRFALLVSRAVLAVPHAILAAPVGERGAIQLHPDPPGLRQAVRQLVTGAVVKIHLRFAGEPPLPPSARNRTAFLHANDATVPTFWNDPYDPSLVTGWTGGPAAGRLRELPRDEIIGRTLAVLARGSHREADELQRALSSAEVIDWVGDPFARGAYAWVPVGGLSAPDTLAEPVARTIWVAGEATNLERMGTIDGALESGKRAAREILDVLG